MTDEQRKMFNKFFFEQWDSIKKEDFDLKEFVEEGAKATGYAEATVRSYFYAYLHETHDGRREPVLTDDGGIKFEYIGRSNVESGS